MLASGSNNKFNPKPLAAKVHVLRRMLESMEPGPRPTVGRTAQAAAHIEYPIRRRDLRWFYRGAGRIHAPAAACVRQVLSTRLFS